MLYLDEESDQLLPRGAVCRGSVDVLIMAQGICFHFTIHSHLLTVPHWAHLVL